MMQRFSENNRGEAAVAMQPSRLEGRVCSLANVPAAADLEEANLLAWSPTSLCPPPKLGRGGP